MRSKVGLIALVCTLSVGLWAQEQPSQKAGQEKNLGSVRYDRNSTEPPVTPSAQNAEQNTLVGCISGSGSKLLLTQPQLRRTYELRGDTSTLQNSVGKMVKVTGRLVLGPTSAFDVQQAQPVQDKCEYEQTGTTLPATGKTGNAGSAENVTSTATVEQTTPGVQTEHGVQQNPSKQESKKYGSKPPMAGRFRVAGDASKLKEHLNHVVRVVGNKTGTYGPAIGASGSTATIHVQAIQDVASTCQGK